MSAAKDAGRAMTPERIAEPWRQAWQVEGCERHRLYASWNAGRCEDCAALLYQSVAVEVERATIERCVTVASESRLTSSHIGPLFNAGWAECAEYIRLSLRGLLPREGDQ
jgi:hypothetical protein